MCSGGADEPGGAVRVVAGCRDCGEAEEAFGRKGQDTELATESELVAERFASGVGVPGEQCGEPVVALEDHPAVGVVEFARERDRALHELPGVAIAAQAKGLVGRGGEKFGEDVHVAGLVQ